MASVGGPTVWVPLASSAVVGGATAFLATRWLIRRLKKTRMVGRDIHKMGQPEVPEMGGLAVIAGFYAGVTFLQLFSPDGPSPGYLHASLVAALGAGFVGLLDDLFDLRQRVKAVLPFLFAIPLASIAFRDAEGGTVLLYADIGALILVAIPLGVTSAANASNMLEGFNGLGAGIGVIMCGTMLGVAIVTGNLDGLSLILPLLGALAAFLYFNKYPSKVFPGDSMTLFVGATIAAAAIMTHQKTYGAFLFLPLIVEFFLKARGRFRGENYGVVDADGFLTYDGRIESITHALMKWRKMREPHLVAVLWSIEAVIGILVVLAASAGL